MIDNLIDDEIRYSTLVRAPIEKVYDGIATAAGLDGWFTNGASVDARPGGEIVSRWEQFGADKVSAIERGRVLEAQRPRRFVFKWHPSDNPDWMSTVEIIFEPQEGGVLIRLREYGYPDTAEGLRAMLNCAAGWGEALTLWKFYLEHGIRFDSITRDQPD